MYGRVKQLRECGKRLSDRAISATPFTEGEVVVHGVAGLVVAEVKQANTQVGGPLLLLYDVRLTTMTSSGMLLKGEERPHGADGPAYVQEWSIRFQ